ncbi:LuxR C-terminal-related transcriptional regulator [Streptomyces sp. SID13031]|uniref:LuxR C-terminal-related transcriptional regulator n=1 Tax=Streptomyces sp. SID13031 TaxID=2706046 RepID=UPI0019410064|nr:LuxR C-terminal-related transcriptional regulator [Streptomyces sp. SID13031]
MTILQNDPLAPENRDQPHPRPPEPHLRDVSRDLHALDHDPLNRDLAAREVPPHEPLGRDVRAREALARVGRGAHREISHDDLQLLRLLATGLPMDSVARRLDLSERTVRRRTRAACDRLGFGTAVEAIVWAARRGLL